MSIVNKPMFITLASTVLILVMVILLFPTTVHALVATLIQDTDNPARHPWSFYCAAGTDISGAAQCNVPAASQIIVIQNASFQVQYSGSAPPEGLIAGLTYISAGTEIHWLPQTSPFSSFGGSNSLARVERAGTAYVDPGSSGTTATIFIFPPRLNLQCHIYLTGYYVTK